MKNHRTVIDLMVGLIIIPLIIIPLLIATLPVERWLKENMELLLALVVYVYGLYGVYRWANIPKMFMRKKFGRIILLLVLLASITGLFTHFMIHPEQMSKGAVAVRAQTIWALFFIVTGFSLAIEVTFELFNQMLAQKELAVEKNKAELALYKAQINPHFLFNTLNALYALIIQKSENAESAFIKFSNLLRYMYTQMDNDFIPIGKEVEYIRQYVDLQKLRLNHHTKVDFAVNIDDGNVFIAPMLLISFIENAFKFAVSSEKDSFIHISICMRNKCLDFRTENDIVKDSGNDTTAIGVANCRKRLELLYDDRFSLDIDNDGRKFKTHLTIDLQ